MSKDNYTLPRNKYAELNYDYSTGGWMLTEIVKGEIVQQKIDQVLLLEVFEELSNRGWSVVCKQSDYRYILTRPTTVADEDILER